MIEKPVVIVMSADTDEQFDWMSDGWNTVKNPNPKLMNKATAAIKAATDVKDAIERLKAAGFEVRRAVEAERLKAAGRIK